MAQSLSQVYVHITFSTKHRANAIDETIENELHSFIAGICNSLKCNAVKVGGYYDHIHILCQLERQTTQSDLLEQIKKRSSKWIKTKGEKYKTFYWQDGYGIFSVNPSEIDKVVTYIENQKTHHSKKTFQSEFRAFLKKYKIEYDERYVWG
jgi:REP element-mobilizing transposase RayT